MTRGTRKYSGEIFDDVDGSSHEQGMPIRLKEVEVFNQKEGDDELPTDLFLLTTLPEVLDSIEKATCACEHM